METEWKKESKTALVCLGGTTDKNHGFTLPETEVELNLPGGRTVTLRPSTDRTFLRTPYQQCERTRTETGRSGERIRVS